MKLLIVDDEVIAIEGILANADFQGCGIDGVYTANSMQQAKDILCREGISIVLCDIEMPNGNGLLLIEWVGEHYPQIVSIILSCHSEFEFARRAVSLSCMEYILKPATPDILADVLRRAVQESESRNSDEKIRKLGEAYVHRLAAEEENEVSAVEQVQRYITEHIEEELSVEGLSRMVYLSANHLARCFKKKYGRTITEYITDYRMGLAEELLQKTDLTVTAVSSRVGIPNYAYFSRQFKRYSGCSPSQYRNRYGGR